MSNNTVAVNIPANMVAQLELFMQNINVEAAPAPVMNEDVGMETDEVENEEVEVVEVVRHTVVDGVWYFELRFTDGDQILVPDDQCSCEWLISNYLEKLGIKTVYVFCRVSTKEQAGSTNLSLEAQEHEIIPLVQAFDRVKIIKISCSAYRNMPPALVDIADCAKKGDAIFVWRVDRLSRNIFKCLEFLEEMHRREVVIYAVDDGLDYSSNKTDFIQAVLNAQKEAELLGARVRLANRRKRQRGDEAIGSLPFGKQYQRILDRDGNTVRKVVVDNADEVALRAFVRSSRVESGELATLLNNQNRLKRGRKWTRAMINNMRK
jgi:DNA invertase Pin-like site-specific DNA recombinase